MNRCAEHLKLNISPVVTVVELPSRVRLCDPVDCSLPGSSVQEISHVRTLEWVPISFSNAGKWKVKVKSVSRVWLFDPMDCSLPGSSTHGIFQARVLEWGAIAFSHLPLKLAQFLELEHLINTQCWLTTLLSSPLHSFIIPYSLSSDF